MFSAVWLQSSFSIWSWLIGTRAMRVRERHRVRLELVVGNGLEDQADAAASGAGISSPVSR